MQHSILKLCMLASLRLTHSQVCIGLPILDLLLALWPGLRTVIATATDTHYCAQTLSTWHGPGKMTKSTVHHWMPETPEEYYRSLVLSAPVLGTRRKLFINTRNYCLHTSLACVLRRWPRSECNIQDRTLSFNPRKGLLGLRA